MALGTWWKGDSLPTLAALPAFSIRRSTDTQYIMRLNNLSQEEVSRRFETGNHFYLAFLEETPVAYGWVATTQGGIEELHLYFTVSQGNRYLWDFQTLPEWRGRGVYSHFLQAIIRQELDEAERFWILFEPENGTAERSIARAGFRFLGELVVTDGRVSELILFDQSERASVGAAFLGLHAINSIDR